MHYRITSLLQYNVHSSVRVYMRVAVTRYKKVKMNVSIPDLSPLIFFR